MTMTPEQIELVRKSFDGLWPVRRKLAKLFYSRFFELAPESRRLFPDSMEKQNLKLMDALAAMVGALDQREMFQAIISHSARQHAQFGATPSQFAAFGEALMWGLQQQFGPAFTPELREAWSTLYETIQCKMAGTRGV
jgi:hemoglobin-like flavoprotein